MKSFDLHASTGKGKVVNVESCSNNKQIMVSYYDYNIDQHTESYILDCKHYNQLRSYKSVAALVRYAKANQTQLISSCPAPAPVAVTSGDCGQGILFCDVETTGLGRDAEVVEIALVDTNETIVFDTLIQPTKLPIPSKATAIHGIKTSDVMSAPRFDLIFSDFADLISGKQLVFYNAAYDTRIISQSIRRAFNYSPYKFWPDFFPSGRQPQCLMEDYAEYWGDWSLYHQSYTWQKLIDACIQQGIPIDDIPNHRASGDAIKTARLYKHLVSVGALS